MKMMVKPVFFRPKRSLYLLCSHGTQRGYRCSPTQRNQIRKNRGDQTSEDQNNICGPSEKDFWDAIWPDYIVALYIRLSKLADCVCVFAALVLYFTGAGVVAQNRATHKKKQLTLTHNVSQIKHRISAKKKRRKSLNRVNQVRPFRMRIKDGCEHTCRHTNTYIRKHTQRNARTLFSPRCILLQRSLAEDPGACDRHIDIQPLLSMTADEWSAPREGHGTPPFT